MTLLVHASTAIMNVSATKNIGKSLDNFIIVTKKAMSKITKKEITNEFT